MTMNCFVIPSQAETRTEPFAEGVIRLDLPSDWRRNPLNQDVSVLLYNDSFNGAPLALAIHYIGFDENFDIAAPVRAEEYAQTKRQWLANQKGREILMYPYEGLALKSEGQTVYSLGVRYVLQNTEFDERAYFIKCQGHIFFAGGLMNAAQRKNKALTVFENAMRSFTCAM